MVSRISSILRSSTTHTFLSEHISVFGRGGSFRVRKYAGGLCIPLVYVEVRVTPVSMSVDNLRGRPRVSQTDPPHGSQHAVTPRLCQRVCRRSGTAGILPEVASTAAGSLGDGDAVSGSGTVAPTLDVARLVLTALYRETRHWTGLMEETARLSSVQPRPGTVSLWLHDVDSDCLTRHPLAQTSQDSISASLLDRSGMPQPTWRTIC